MFKFLWGAIQSFLFDEQAFKRIMRPLLISFGLGGVAFGDQVGQLFGAPGAARWIKVAALVCGFIGGAIKMGEKNLSPEEMYDRVHSEKVKRAEEGLEVTDPRGLPLPKQPAVPQP